MPPKNLLPHAKLEDTSISEGEILTILQVAEICNLNTTTFESQYANTNATTETSTSNDIRPLQTWHWENQDKKKIVVPNYMMAYQITKACLDFHSMSATIV